MRSFEPEEQEIVMEAPSKVSAAAPVEVKQETPAKKPAAKKEAQPDDLTEIKGIGPVYAARLVEAGITTFADITAATAEHLREVTQATAAADPETWIAQAREK